MQDDENAPNSAVTTLDTSDGCKSPALYWQREVAVKARARLSFVLQSELVSSEIESSSSEIEIQAQTDKPASSVEFVQNCRPIAAHSQQTSRAKHNREVGQTLHSPKTKDQRVQTETDSSLKMLECLLEMVHSA